MEPEEFLDRLGERETVASMGFLDFRERRGTEAMQVLKDSRVRRERSETGAMTERSGHEGYPVTQAPVVYSDRRDQRDLPDLTE